MKNKKPAFININWKIGDKESDLLLESFLIDFIGISFTNFIENKYIQFEFAYKNLDYNQLAKIYLYIKTTNIFKYDYQQERILNSLAGLLILNFHRIDAYLQKQLYKKKLSDNFSQVFFRNKNHQFFYTFDQHKDDLINHDILIMNLLCYNSFDKQQFFPFLPKENHNNSLTNLIISFDFLTNFPTELLIIKKNIIIAINNKLNNKVNLSDDLILILIKSYLKQKQTINKNSNEFKLNNKILLYLHFKCKDLFYKGLLKKEINLSEAILEEIKN